MKIRAFLALELPQTVRNKLSAHVELISGHDKLQQFRWVPKQNYHLTLVFLGNVEYVLISSLQLKLEQNLSSNKAVPFRFSEITPFPFSGTPKIAAAMLERSEELMQLQHNTANCVRGFGISLERRRFTPHVTLGRLKFRSRKSLAFQPQQIYLDGVSEKVVIFQSELTPKGAVYTPLGEISLM
ncbi:MAG: RNA 2',3'-cyclic phosphodiesterase [SAR324 cluster bacterium]|nr:RNA 2',3'-cyclic phosphodiesterase [SAR324 cluster bacterium]